LHRSTLKSACTTDTTRMVMAEQNKPWALLEHESYLALEGYLNGQNGRITWSQPAWYWVKQFSS
jgi:hypothetical protein